MAQNYAFYFIQDGKQYDLYNLPAGFIIKVDIDISGMKLTKLPDLTNVICLGIFDCSNNNLTSLRGSPRKTKVFNCSYNYYLTSLLEGPTEADEYNCHNCNLLNLKGAPQKTKKFNCSWNYYLTSLLGGPTEADEYNCSHTSLITLNGMPKKLTTFNFNDAFYSIYLKKQDIKELLKLCKPYQILNIYKKIRQK